MKNGKLNGKVAVVTGASKGIGAGIAKQFAAEGASVVVNYASSKTDADRIVDEIMKRGGTAVAVQGDVAKKADVERLFAVPEKALGKIDILVNNAGVYAFTPLEEVTEEKFHKHFDVNVLGLLLVTQEALKHFNPAGGSIINISSGVSTVTPPNFSVYNGTKAAVDAITRTLAKELGPRGIRVNAINPGWGNNRRRHCRRTRPERLSQDSGIADAAGADRSAGRYRAGGGLLRFIRFEMDHRRNTTHRGRCSLGVYRK